MKPSWDDAPDWANYRAMDEDEAWYWYEYEPTQKGFFWDKQGGRSQLILDSSDNWRDSLEERPKEAIESGEK